MSIKSNKVSVCVLLYGHHTDLAKRCLGSIEAALPSPDLIQDFRIGKNGVSESTSEYVREWVGRVHLKTRIPCITYAPFGNVLKYPTMRRMFFDDKNPLADYTMWFDDDSYIDGGHNFWSDVVNIMKSFDMVGQHWYKGFIGRQRDWIKTQKWAIYPEVEASKVRFCTGGWWTIRSRILHEFDWPFKAIRHKGGDMILGELFRQQGLRMGQFCRGVRINADAEGGHSKAARRGYSANNGIEMEVGYNYAGNPLSEDHQKFELWREIIK